MLTLSAPRAVRAQAGYDALAHAVETWVTTRANALSLCFAREAWRLLHTSFEAVLENPSADAAAAMQVGSHLAGAAIENSMLGATHACANPLTQRYGAVHGAALAVLLPHVVEWNAEVCAARYAELDPDLPGRLRSLAGAAGLPSNLRAFGVKQEDLVALADAAADQWTGRFNPRPFDAKGALEIYRWAF